MDISLHVEVSHSVLVHVNVELSSVGCIPTENCQVGGKFLPSLQHGILWSEENVVLNNIVNPKMAKRYLL